MKRKIFLLSGLASILTATVAVNGAETTINGAGATFPAPVYSSWTYKYKEKTGTRINYQAVGSGAGIAQIKAKTVDFGASDEPLEKEELNKYGLTQFPMLMGGVVPVVNIPGVESGKLQLTPKVLADIFLGKIKKWDDAAIASVNSGLKLPSMPITVVYRSDGSGTTWIFTNYLSKISQDWANGPGNGKSVKWPVGVGGQKNPGVANNVQKISGSIGYVEYTYAFEGKLSCAALQNKAGKFVAPGIESFISAGANADWKNAPGFYMVLTDQPGEKSWPILGVTYILAYKEQKDAVKSREMMKYFNWCYTDEGSKTASTVNYVPIPENVVKMVKEEWKKNIKCDGKSVTE